MEFSWPKVADGREQEETKKRRKSSAHLAALAPAVRPDDAFRHTIKLGTRCGTAGHLQTSREYHQFFAGRTPGRADSCTETAKAGFSEDWLGGLDSNQDSQIQNLKSCQLDDLPAGTPRTARSNKNESQHVPGFGTATIHSTRIDAFTGPVNPRTADEAAPRPRQAITCPLQSAGRLVLAFSVAPSVIPTTAISPFALR